jgi:hypothetical protein
VGKVHGAEPRGVPVEFPEHLRHRALALILFEARQVTWRELETTATLRDLLDMHAALEAVGAARAKEAARQEAEAARGR